MRFWDIGTPYWNTAVTWLSLMIETVVAETSA
jgi:hypothetical protein